MMGEILSGSPQWFLLLAQGTACLALGLIVSYALSRRSAKAHQALWIAMVAAVLMPTAHRLVDRFELGILSAEASSVSIHIDMPPTFPATSGQDNFAVVDPPVATAVAPQPETVTSPTVATPPETRIETARTVPWRTIGAVAWLAATVLLLARLLLRFVLGLRLVHRADDVDSEPIRNALEEAKARVGIDATVTIRRSDQVRSPIIWCWAHRPILLVHSDTRRTDHKIDWTGVFCHELAHWKRRDHVTGLFAEVLAALLAWHPLLWWTRHRLMLLSEAACDDWVLAGGQVGLDYAESLLNLSPERQLAFLPTVVGKERAMKDRICRIVKDRCGNPRISLRWTLAVVAMAALVTAGTALAQRRPSERRERQEQQEVLELRRAALHQELEQLVDQARDLEAAIRKRGDEPNPERQAMKFRLELKHQIIQAMERRLANLEQPGDRRRGDRSEIDARMEELGRRQDELREHGGNLERKLEELGDRHPEARERMEMELREVGENLERLEMEKAELASRRTGARQRGGRPEIKARMEEMERRQDELREHAGNLERELEKLGDRRPEAREQLKMELREVQENLERLEMERVEIDRSQGRSRDARPREVRPEVRDLTERLRNLRQRGQEIREELGRVDDKDSERAQNLRMAMEETREEMRITENKLKEIAGPPRLTRERGRDEDLARAREGLMAQIRMAEEKLHEAEQARNSGATERVRRMLEQLHERREAMDRRTPERDMSGPAREGIEGEVEALRQKVDGMHEQMQEMREMLHQLLQRREATEREEVERDVVF